MNYAQLRAFHHVALCGGFSRAARLLHLTQPAISDQVRKLETSYDVLLFDRTARQVHLTRTGERLFQLTKPLFEGEQRIDEFLTESRAAPAGKLRIVADSALHIIGPLRSFTQKHPQVFVSMRTGNTDEVLSELRAYNAEIGIVGSMEPGREFGSVDLGASCIVAFAARGYLPHQAFTLHKLAQYPLIFREAGSKTRQKLVEEAARQGVTLSPTMEVEGREAVREVVASGAGIGFVSEAEFVEDSRLVRLPLVGTDLTMSETLVFLQQRRDLRLINAFVEICSSGTA